MKHFFNPNNIIFVQPSIIYPERKESIDRKVFQRRKKKKKNGRMESCSWIDGKLDGYRFPWNFKRQLEPSSDFSRHEFWAIFGRQGPKPHRDVVVAQWEERLEAYFWLVRYQWAALLHHSPYLLYFYVGQPTRGQIVILFFFHRRRF